MQTINGLRRSVRLQELKNVKNISQSSSSPLPSPSSSLHIGKMNKISSSSKDKKNPKPKGKKRKSSKSKEENDQQSNGNKKSKINWDEFIPATGLKNYIMKDGFLDTLQIKSSAVIKSDPDFSKYIAKSIEYSNKTDNFTATLLQHGKLFEQKIINLMKTEVGQNNFVDIQGDSCPRSEQKYLDTLTAIREGVPFITQAILRNYEDQTYGVADLLIRSDYLNNFLDVPALSPQEASTPAPLISSIPSSKTRKNTRNTKGKKIKNARAKARVKPLARATASASNSPYHYVVVDIKYKTLILRSDGIHLRNDNILKAYKSQLWIYNNALGKIQGYTPPYAFILGSKWKYTSCGINHEGNSCFHKLARIDYSDLDAKYIEESKNAVQWLKDLKREGDKWDLSQYPLPRKELYPNMCNSYDYPYHEIKKAFAEKHKDLTLIRNVGVKHRENAFQHGVYTWDDPKCSVEVLGLKGKTAKIVQPILTVNSSDSTREIIPKKILSNYGNWKSVPSQKSKIVEVFVDFEMTCPVFTDFADLPNNFNVGKIFMIGAGYIQPTTNKWIFRKFIANSLTDAEEYRICKEFSDFLSSLSLPLSAKNRNKRKVKCYHWSSAECSTWDRAMRKLTASQKKHVDVFENKNVKKGKNVEWVDLLKVFLEGGVAVKGVLNYGLKNIAKAFHRLGFIQTTWGESECADGADAAVNVYRAHMECQYTQSPLSQHPILQDIAVYNEVDVKVLQEILYYLRKHHT